MKLIMQIFQWISENNEIAISLGTGIYEFIARIFKTKVDYSLINFIKRILDAVIPNRVIPPTE